MQMFFQDTEQRTGGMYPRTDGSAAIDLSTKNHDIILEPQKPTLILTGKKIHIRDKNIAGLLLLRSSLSMQMLSLANGVGLIDSDYQGEIAVVLFNHRDEPFKIPARSRIAQLVFVKIISPSDVDFVQVQNFDQATIRGEGGFGSTGTDE